MLIFLMEDYEPKHSQEEEMELALKEGRQPNCMYCGKTLDRIAQTQYDKTVLEWDGKLKKYLKQDPEGDSDAPYHTACWSNDWAYVDEKLVGY